MDDVTSRLMQLRFSPSESTESYSAALRGFSKDQRVSHTAIVENKRLGHALAIVKAQQDLRLATKVMASSEKTAYKKKIREVYAHSVAVAETTMQALS